MIVARSSPKPRPLPEDTYSRLKEVVSKNRGSLPGGNERDETKKMLFCCNLGHKWRAVPYNILKGSWCPHPNCCGPRISRGRAAKTLESQCQRIIEIVEQRRGKWLGGEYKNNSTPLNFACQNGHLFSMRPDNVFQGLKAINGLLQQLLSSIMALGARNVRINGFPKAEEPLFRTSNGCAMVYR